MERIPCDPNRECRLRDTIGCFEDVDHEYWPSRQYRTPIEKQFRQLDENKTLICRDMHNERHATELPPPKPDRDVMIEAVRRSMAGLALTSAE